MTRKQEVVKHIEISDYENKNDSFMLTVLFFIRMSTCALFLNIALLCQTIEEDNQI